MQSVIKCFAISATFLSFNQQFTTEPRSNSDSALHERLAPSIEIFQRKAKRSGDLAARSGLNRPTKVYTRDGKSQGNGNSKIWSWISGQKTIQRENEEHCESASVCQTIPCQDKLQKIKSRSEDDYTFADKVQRLGEQDQE